eukprot:jgi/Chlat1/2781/Chrsp187S02912
MAKVGRADGGRGEEGAAAPATKRRKLDLESGHGKYLPAVVPPPLHHQHYPKQQHGREEALSPRITDFFAAIGKPQSQHNPRPAPPAADNGEPKQLKQQQQQAPTNKSTRPLFLPTPKTAAPQLLQPAGTTKQAVARLRAAAAALTAGQGLQKLRQAARENVTPQAGQQLNSIEVQKKQLPSPSAVKLAPAATFVTAAPPALTAVGGQGRRMLAAAMAKVTDPLPPAVSAGVTKLLQSPVKQQTPPRSSPSPSRRDAGCAASPSSRPPAGRVARSLFRIDEASIACGSGREMWAALTEGGVDAVGKPGHVGLQLPVKCNGLLEMFAALESAVELVRKRQQSCTLLNLQKSVELSCNRRFTAEHVAQMKYVYPEVLHLSYTRQTVLGLDGNSTRQNQLLIDLLPQPASTPIRTPTRKPSGSPCKAPSPFKRQAAPSPQSSPLKQSRHLMSRKDVFKSRLLEIVKGHHSQFLRHIQATSDPSQDMSRPLWHFQFELDEVPDIPTTALPKQPPATPPRLFRFMQPSTALPPSKDAVRTASALSTPLHIAIARDSTDPTCTPRLQTPAPSDHKRRASPEAACTPASDAQATCSNNSASTTNTCCTAGTSTNTASTDGLPRTLRIRNIPQTLLQAVEQREQKLQAINHPDVASTRQRNLLLKGLPLLYDITCSVFISSKRTAMPANELLSHILKSHKHNPSRDIVEIQLKLFVELVPEWFEMQPSRFGYLLCKLKDKVNPRAVRQKLVQASQC